MPYTIQHGDTLWGIAQRNHISLGTLLRMNPEFTTNPKYRGGSMIWAGGHVMLPGDSGGGGGGHAAAPPAPPPPAPPLDMSPEAVLLRELEGMPGQERDAYAALKTLFNSYGLDSLSPKILRYLQDGFASETITALLQVSPEYKSRFAGNEARKANGLAVLTPAEYLSTEASYRQILQASGIDPAAMTKQQYSEWIGKDISPNEIQNRVNLGVQAYVNADQNVTNAFATLGINHGDIVSYFMNDQNPMPALQLKLNQAQIMGAGGQSGLTVDPNQALKFAQQGVTYQQAQGAYQKVGEVTPTGAGLSQIYKQQTPYGQTQAENEFLGSDAQATLAREALGRQETAAFQGQGGESEKSLKPPSQNAPFV